MHLFPYEPLERNRDSISMDFALSNRRPACGRDRQARDDVRMSKLSSRPVDPRDQQWELWHPRYRVCFWKPVSSTGWESREFEVSGGDIFEVLDWARGSARDGETFAVFAVVGDAEGLGVVRLTGDDPTRASGI